MIKWILPLLFCLSAHAQIVLRGGTLRGATISVVTTPPLQVTTILDFHSQTIGQKYDTNLIGSDVWGNPSGWSVTSEGTIYDKIFTNVIGPDFTFDQPVQALDGHTASSTGTNWVREDLSAGGGLGTEILLYNALSTPICSVNFYQMFTNINAGNANSRDVIVFYGNPYTSAQLGFDNGNIGTYGSQVRSGLHSSLGGSTPSVVAGLPTNTWIKAEEVWNATNGVMFVTYRNATNNALIFSSVAYGDLDANVQNFFRFEAGYIYASPITGFNIRGPLYINSNPSTNRPPWVPVAPSNIASVQTGPTTATVSLTDNCLMLNSNLFHMSNSVDGDTNVWILPSSTNGVMRGLVQGHTYDTRADAYFRNGVKSIATAGSTLTMTNWPLPLTNGLLMRWLLNENGAAGGVLIDWFTNHYDGAYQGSPEGYVQVEGTNYAASLNGTDNYLLRDTSPITAPPFSVSFWIKGQTVEANELGILSGATIQYDGWAGYIPGSTGTALFQTFVNGDTTDPAPASIAFTASPSSWFHVVFVVTSSSSKDIWINGVKGTTGTSNRSPNQGSYIFSVGALVKGDGPAQFSNGQFNDIQAYNRALTSDEITFLYQQGPDKPTQQE